MASGVHLVLRLAGGRGSGSFARDRPKRWLACAVQSERSPGEGGKGAENGREREGREVDREEG